MTHEDIRSASNVDNSVLSSDDSLSRGGFQAFERRLSRLGRVGSAIRTTDSGYDSIVRLLPSGTSRADRRSRLSSGLHDLSSAQSRKLGVDLRHLGKDQYPAVGTLTK